MDNTKWGAQLVPASAAEFALRALVAAGHVSQELVDRALALPGAPQPVEREPAQWQRRHQLRTNGEWKNTDEHDAKWWRDNSQGWEIRALYTTPQPTQAQAEPKSGAKSFQTYGEANAYSKGYYAGKKAATQAADSVLEDAARESEYRRGYRHGYEQRDAEVRGALA